MQVVLFFQVKENNVIGLFVEMSIEIVTVMNDVNNFASINLGIVENLNILLWTLEYP